MILNYFNSEDLTIRVFRINFINSCLKNDDTQKSVYINIIKNCKIIYRIITYSNLISIPVRSLYICQKYGKNKQYC